MTSADLVEVWVQSILRGQSRCTIAFPGGQSAIALMADLAEREIAWERIKITLVDERAVPMTDPLSNAALVVRAFEKSLASGATFSALMVGDTAIDAAKQLNDAASNHPDISVLGMGEDGHFASLFPGQRDALEKPDVGFIATQPFGKPAVARISMTIPMLSHARNRLLLVSNEPKAGRVRDAIASGKDPSNPVSYLLNSSYPWVVQWPDGRHTEIQRGIEAPFHLG